ncbi:MAG: hypothetical protein KatS3mg111_3541 [Pirellulaceae bacterium]|nr:MAG: hypothetical protein KatS3mg111_3541 [Pirellulaceae bacterium]
MVMQSPWCAVRLGDLHSASIRDCPRNKECDIRPRYNQPLTRTVQWWHANSECHNSSLTVEGGLLAGEVVVAAGGVRRGGTVQRLQMARTILDRFTNFAGGQR